MIELDPPKTLPLGQYIWRLFMYGSASDLYAQLTVSLLNGYANAAGIWIFQFHQLSEPPASIKSTLIDGSSVRRFASTQPAEPAPTTI